MMARFGFMYMLCAYKTNIIFNPIRKVETFQLDLNFLNTQMKFKQLSEILNAIQLLITINSSRACGKCRYLYKIFFP